MYKKIIISIIILATTVFTYVASLISKGEEGLFGFSSLRVTFNQISFLTFALVASLRLFYLEKGKDYRFVYLVPIVVISYDLFVNVLDARKTYYNEFTPKLGITIVIVLGVLIGHVVKKQRKNG